MAFACDLCGKGVTYGETHTHKRGVAGGRWKKKAQSTRKVFAPNLHTYKKLKFCTKCLRIVKQNLPVVKATVK